MQHLFHLQQLQKKVLITKSKYVNNVDAGYGFVIAVAKGNYEGHATSTTWNDADHKVNYALNDGKLTKNGVTLATNVIDAVAFTINPAVFTAKNITGNKMVFMQLVFQLNHR